MDNAKSATSKSPVPPVVSYTLSLKVTVSSVLAVVDAGAGYGRGRCVSKKREVRGSRVRL